MLLVNRAGCYVRAVKPLRLLTQDEACAVLAPIPCLRLVFRPLLCPCSHSADAADSNTTKIIQEPLPEGSQDCYDVIVSDGRRKVC